MGFTEAIILGVIQGLTEFIPVSSSGHLLLLHSIFGAGELDLSVDAILQLGSMIAVLIYFRKDLKGIIISLLYYLTGRKNLLRKEELQLLGAIFWGSLPALIAGYFLENLMGSMFRNESLVAYALLVGSIIMIISERLSTQDRQISSKSGFIVGIFQSLALIPGISRSGATISGGLLVGLKREDAARFSFLLSFPIILISGAKKFYDISASGEIINLGFPLVLSFLISFIVGLWAIDFLIKYLRKNSLNLFVWYRVILAIVILLLIAN